MSQRVVGEYNSYWILLAVLIQFGYCCDVLEWKCNNGECVTKDKLCDGYEDCSDKSDETKNACYQHQCPTYAFRCAYGACVIGTAKCNGETECADNSDELTCANEVPDEIHWETLMDPDKVDSCRLDQFECAPSECISLVNVCDGPADCKNKADENVKLCSFNVCPNYAFRCGYGACINSEKKCNGNNDCADGSDELPTLCFPEQQIQQEAFPIKNCVAPIISNGRLVDKNQPNKIFEAGEIVENNVTILYECSHGYKLVGVSVNECLDSKWLIQPDPVCIKYCSANMLRDITFKAYCNIDGINVSCKYNIRPGTVATIKCAYRYNQPDSSAKNQIVCGDDGEWDNIPKPCEQICDDKLPESNSLKTNNVYAGIFRNNNGHYEHICNGTIVSAKVVIAAADCFLDGNQEPTRNRGLFSVAAGKANLDYMSNERQAQYRNIAQINIKSGFEGNLYNLGSNIAVLELVDHYTFSSNIGPACIDWKIPANKLILSDISSLAFI